MGHVGVASLKVGGFSGINIDRIVCESSTNEGVKRLYTYSMIPQVPTSADRHISGRRAVKSQYKRLNSVMRPVQLKMVKAVQPEASYVKFATKVNESKTLLQRLSNSYTREYLIEFPLNPTESSRTVFMRGFYTLETAYP